MKSGRIAVPSEGQGGLDAQRSGHFGHCSVFTVINLDQGEITHIDTVPNAEHSEGGCLVPVNLLADNQVTALIAAGMGLRPLQGFESVGIDVYFDREHADVKSAVEALIDDKLTKMTPQSTCQGHD